MKNQLVEEWLERGKRDLETAKILFSSSDYFEKVYSHAK